MGIGDMYQAQIDAKDAKRYRCLRNTDAGGHCVRNGELQTGERLDKLVDECLAQSGTTYSQSDASAESQP